MTGVPSLADYAARVLEEARAQTKWTIKGRWLGDNLWSCHACLTRNLRDDAVCTNCAKGVRPDGPHA